MRTLALFFGWPAGGVWSNLLASAICSAAVYVKLHFEAIRRHEELKRHVTKVAFTGGRRSR